MSARQRLTTALVLVLALVSVVPCTPAPAQTGPTSVQYVGESPETFADNTEPGTDAVNDAMSGSTSSATPSASDDASASPAGGTSNSDADRDGNSQTGSVVAADAGNEALEEPEASANAASEEGEAPASITRLPETGGAPLAALGSGLLLATFGLVAVRLAGR